MGGYYLGRGLPRVCAHHAPAIELPFLAWGRAHDFLREVG